MFWCRSRLHATRTSENKICAAVVSQPRPSCPRSIFVIFSGGRDVYSGGREVFDPVLRVRWRPGCPLSRPGLGTLRMAPSLRNHLTWLLTRFDVFHIQCIDMLFLSYLSFYLVKKCYFVDSNYCLKLTSKENIQKVRVFWDIGHFGWKRGKTEFWFLEKDFSANSWWIHLKISEFVLHSIAEGTVSQIFDLGPGCWDTAFQKWRPVKNWTPKRCVFT